jgi:glycosyltransferase involved in cell wall biosynthesis
MPIPSEGWGAVETVIWQQKVYLEKLGSQVDILNERGLLEALRSRPWSYDLVHLHYDELAGFWVRLQRWLRFNLIITTHYGYAAYPDRWEGDYYQGIFNQLKKAPALLLLSGEIEKAFRKLGYKGWIGVLPNGTEVEQIHYKARAGNGRTLCLGKVEPRKRQADLARLFDKHEVKCDFVGPQVDAAFKTDGKSTRYLGTWTRAQVHQNLTDYSCLVLASDGEAHPLVVLEALAAGLSIVVTREAAANLDLSKPWVFVEKEIGESLAVAAQKACLENYNYRNDIRSYAEAEFDWGVITKKYLQLAQEVIKGRSLT